MIKNCFTPSIIFIFADLRSLDCYQTQFMKISFLNTIDFNSAE